MSWLLGLDFSLDLLDATEVGWSLIRQALDEEDLFLCFDEPTVTLPLESLFDWKTFIGPSRESWAPDKSLKGLRLLSWKILSSFVSNLSRFVFLTGDGARSVLRIAGWSRLPS